MSFAGQAKAELCQQKIEKKCCALAESYGALLYGHSFSPREIRIVTAGDAFAARLPKLFKRAFGLSFDQAPPPGAGGKRSFSITDREKLEKIFAAFGFEIDSALSQHVNFGVLEEDCCRLSFLRGAFLAGGSVTDPDKRYHLELGTVHRSVCRETVPLLQDLGFSPKETARGGDSLLYFKQADAIADLLTALGAPVAALGVMTAKVEREMRNTVTRQINCDSANADKTVAAAQTQIEAIHALGRAWGLESLPEPLHDAALLRITNPEASLADLAQLSSPPVSKSCLSHRLRKLVDMAGQLEGSGEETNTVKKPSEP